MPNSPETLALKAAYDLQQKVIWGVRVDPPGSHNFIFLFFTEEYRRQVGAGQDEFAGKSPQECLSPEDAITIQSHYADCVDAGEAINYPELLDIGGERRWWRTTLTPVKNEQGQIHMLLGESNQISSVEADLRGAIGRQELAVHYQPIIRISGDCAHCVSCGDFSACAATHCLAGYEALIRWNRYSPAEFLPVAKESGLMEQITDFVIHDAARNLKWLPKKLWISVNISNCDFADSIDQAAEKFGLIRSRLSFEVTEDTMLDEAAIARFESIQLLGHPLKIDDWGTQASNLEWLQLLKAKALKIDLRFVRGVAGDRNRQAICSSAIKLAHEYDPPLDVIAEGVEELADLLWLAGQGVDYCQGWLFGRPMPMNQRALRTS